MTGVGRRCLYCSRQIAASDRVALCSRCLTAHHEECWSRNGRCSTFRCTGAPLAISGSDVGAALMSAAQRANANPAECPTCGSRVYTGALRGALRAAGSRTVVPGLLFEEVAARRRGAARRRWGLSWLFFGVAWGLPDVEIPARSCGKCRRLFVWGMPAGSADLQRADEDPERFCPFCGQKLAAGRINLRAARRSLGARFWCDGVPDLHTSWFGHNVIDRFLMNRWRVRVGYLPARSCKSCHYTEVAGRPVTAEA